MKSTFTDIDVLLGMKCPTCGAKPSKPCHSPAGRTYKYHHMDRRDKYRRMLNKERV